MPHPFTIQKSVEDGLAVLEIKGYLDAYTAAEFEKALESEIGAGNNKIIVDCAGLTYISSAGLGVFMGFIEDIRQSGGDIKICALSPKVRQVFEMLGFQQLFHIENSRPEALKRFQENPVWKD